MLSGDRYLNAAQNNQLRTIRVEAQRGSIVDRSGRTIVSNVPGTAVRIWTADLPEGGPLRDVQAALEDPARAAAAADEGARGEQGRPADADPRQDRRPRGSGGDLLEHRADFPGVEIRAPTSASTSTRRSRRSCSATSARSRRGAEAAREAKDRDIRGGEKIGKTGVEAALRHAGSAAAGHGSAPRRLARTAARALRERRPAQSGYNIRLTLDVGLQRAAERALRDGIELAYEDDRFNANGGAIVALDPRDGAVLALASNPTYKPSVYVGRVDPKKLEPLTVERVAKERNYPGINRAIAGVYPPGSTFKPLTALAAISDGCSRPTSTSSARRTPSTASTSSVQELEPVHEHADDALHGARAVVRHLLLRRRQPLLRAGRARAAVLDEDAGLGEEVRLRPAGRARHRRRGVRAAADAGVAEGRRPDRLGQGVEPGRHDPDGDRPEGHQRDAAADGALLRGACERRQARHAAPRPGRRAAGGGGRAGGAGADASRGAAEGDRRRSGRARGRSRRPLRGDPRRERHLVGRLRQLPGPGRGQDRHRGEGRQPARLPPRPPRGSGVVVRLGAVRRQRLRQLPRREADADRRLRRDRERRPRRHGRRAGGAEGLRALVPRARRRPGGCVASD